MLRLLVTSSLVLGADAAFDTQGHGYDKDNIGAFMTAAAARGGTVTAREYANDDCSGPGTISQALCGNDLPDLVARFTAIDSTCTTPFPSGACWAASTSGMRMSQFACNADNTKVIKTEYQSTEACTGELSGGLYEIDAAGHSADLGCMPIGNTRSQDYTCEAACVSTTYGCCDGTDTFAVKTDVAGTNCVGGTAYMNSDAVNKAAAAALAAAGGMAIGVLVAVIVVPILGVILLIVGIVCCCKHCGNKAQA